MNHDIDNDLERVQETIRSGAALTPEEWGTWHQGWEYSMWVPEMSETIREAYVNRHPDRLDLMEQLFEREGVNVDHAQDVIRRCFVALDEKGLVDFLALCFKPQYLGQEYRPQFLFNGVLALVLHKDDPWLAQAMFQGLDKAKNDKLQFDIWSQLPPKDPPVRTLPMLVAGFGVDQWMEGLSELKGGYQDCYIQELLSAMVAQSPDNVEHVVASHLPHLWEHFSQTEMGAAWIEKQCIMESLRCSGQDTFLPAAKEIGVRAKKM